MAQTRPSAKSVLEVLPKARLGELGRDFSIAVRPSATKESQIEELVSSGIGGLVRYCATLGATS